MEENKDKLPVSQDEEDPEGEEKNIRFKTLIMIVERFASMQIPVYAAYACYFLTLSIFPLLLIVLSLVPYLPYSARDLMDLVEQVVPTALMGTVESLIVNIYYNSSGAVLSLSAIVTLWSASRGIYGILNGLNNIYGVRENRSYLYTRGISFFYTFVIILVIVLSLVMQVFGPRILEYFAWLETPLMKTINQIVDVQAIWMLVLQIVAFTAVYMVFPNKRNRLMDSLPGAVIAAVGWQAFTKIYSIYVERLNYTNIYGSVYAVAIAMLWLYCCMSILLFGGGVNRLIQQMLRK